MAPVIGGGGSQGLQSGQTTHQIGCAVLCLHTLSPQIFAQVSINFNLANPQRYGQEIRGWPNSPLNYFQRKGFVGKICKNIFPQIKTKNLLKVTRHSVYYRDFNLMRPQWIGSAHTIFLWCIASS